MDIEEKRDRIFDALSNLDWSDQRTPEIMEGFFNSPSEAIDCAEGEMTDEHIESLFDSLELEEDKTEE